MYVPSLLETHVSLLRRPGRHRIRVLAETSNGDDRRLVAFLLIEFEFRDPVDAAAPVADFEDAEAEDHRGLVLGMAFTQKRDLCVTAIDLELLSDRWAPRTARLRWAWR